MPACDASVAVVFENLQDIQVGAYLWNPQIGYLEVSGYNPDAGYLELRNPCTIGCGDQAEPGTPIMPLTKFIIVAKPCPSAFAPSNNFPFLAAGFTAPENGTCFQTAVTNVNGLVAGKSVIIAGGTYRLNDIFSSVLIELCNDGNGLAAGTAVEYKDSNGNLIVPVTLIDSNPCTNDAVHSGLPIVCIDGIQYPLTGTGELQILCYSSTTNLANFRTIGIPVLNCTALTVCLTLDPALPSDTEYLTTVEDTSDFSETPGDNNNIVTIGGTFFQVTEIVDGTHLRLFPLEPPNAIEVHNPGSQMCSADCCSILDIRVGHLEANEDVNGNQRNAASANYADAVAIAATHIDSGSLTLSGNLAKLTITNPSILSMGVHCTFDFQYVYDLNGADGDVQDVGRFNEWAIDPSDVAATVLLHDLPATHVFQTVPSGTAGVNRHSFSDGHSHFFVIPPGESRTIQGKATMSFNAGDASFVDVKVLATRISYMAVAIG